MEIKTKFNRGDMVAWVINANRVMVVTAITISDIGVRYECKYANKDGDPQKRDFAECELILHNEVSKIGF